MLASASNPSRASRRRPGRGLDSSSGGALRRTGDGSARLLRRRRLPALAKRIVSGPPNRSSKAASAGPRMNPISVIAPYNAVAAGSRSRSTRLGMAASDAGLKSPVPIPATSARASVAGKPSTSPMPRNAAPRRMSETIRQLRLRPAIRCRAEDRAEQTRRHKIGYQDQADRPRRVEPLIGDHEKRDVAGAVTEGRLCEHRVIDAGHALVSE